MSEQQDIEVTIYLYLDRQTDRHTDNAKTITPSTDVKRAASFDMTLEVFPVIARILGKAGLKLFVITRWGLFFMQSF